MAEPWWKEGTCGACIAFQWDGTVPAEGELRRARCRLRAELNIIPETLPGCAKYMERRTGKRLQVKKAVHGRGKPRYDDDTVDLMSGDRPRPSRRSAPVVTPPVRRRAYGKTIDLGEAHSPGTADPSVAQSNSGAGEEMQTEALKELIRDVLMEDGTLGDTVLGQRWQGGTLILKPGVEGQQSKEIPIETFFQKIVMVRDRLRVMEQRINGHKGLTAQDKVELQQYLTRIYGSLTTFNILFADKGDQFSGTKT